MNREIQPYLLYLDDVRDPSTNRDWTVVRSVTAFQETILNQGLPEEISFDHDLGDDVPSGYDAVKWLIDLAIENDLPLENVETNVHSANPVGAENIRGILASFQRFKRME